MTGVPLVDVHSHFLTERYVAEAIRAGHVAPDGMPAWPAWNESQHLRLMDRLGIDVALLSVSSPGVHFGDHAAATSLAQHVNDHAAAVSARSAGRFGFLATLPLPDVEGAVGQARRIGTDGCRGALLLSNAGGRHLGDPAFDPLWAELDARGAVVLIHPTSPPGPRSPSPRAPLPALEFPVETARTVLSMLQSRVPQRFPRIRMVLPHAGGVLAALVDRLETFRLAGHLGEVTEPVPLGIRRFWFDTAGTPLPTLVPALRRWVPSEHLLYGSDFCFTPPAGVALQLGALDAAGAPTPGTTWRDLLAANATALLGPGAATPAPSGGRPLAQRILARVFTRVADRVLLGHPG